MSVYTPVTAEELEAWLTRYAVGGLVSQSPIATGIENTNYFVTTTKGRYVLTLYERLPAEELPFLPQSDGASRPRSEWSARRRSAIARARSSAHSTASRRVLVTRVDGAPVLAPDVPHCAAVGAALGRSMSHRAPIRARLTNRRGPAWCRQAARAVRPYVDPGQSELLAAELKFLTASAKARLPRGAIHGDLFCDNVLFVGDRVSGIIDFGFAATDFLAYDLRDHRQRLVRRQADSGALVPEHVAALVGAYEAVRPLTADERAQWQALLRAAALRFWLSRLYDLYLPRPGELVHAHDPAHFERILRHRIDNCVSLPERVDAPSRWPRGHERRPGADRLRTLLGAPRRHLVEGRRHDADRAPDPVAHARGLLLSDSAAGERRTDRRSARPDGAPTGIHRGLSCRCLDAGTRRQTRDPPSLSRVRLESLGAVAGRASC
jgi:homoserine kinase type II